MRLEDSLKKLEKIVDRLEGGDLSLEDSLKAFEEGVRLARACESSLNDAEKRIEVLMKDGKRKKLEMGDS